MEFYFKNKFVFNFCQEMLSTVKKKKYQSQNYVFKCMRKCLANSLLNINYFLFALLHIPKDKSE